MDELHAGVVNSYWLNSPLPPVEQQQQWCVSALHSNHSPDMRWAGPTDSNVCPSAYRKICKKSAKELLDNFSPRRPLHDCLLLPPKASAERLHESMASDSTHGHLVSGCGTWVTDFNIVNSSCRLASGSSDATNHAVQHPHVFIRITLWANLEMAAMRISAWGFHKFTRMVLDLTSGTSGISWNLGRPNS